MLTVCVHPANNLNQSTEVVTLGMMEGHRSEKVDLKKTKDFLIAATERIRPPFREKYNTGKIRKLK